MEAGSPFFRIFQENTYRCFWVTGKTAYPPTDDGKAIKTCRFLNLPFIISPKIATELYRHGCIEGPLAKAAIEKMRIEGRYASDIIAEALLRLQGDWKC
jgi:hypothetical protein